MTSARPTLDAVEVVPVAGHDSMLVNLSGAHGPFFTRNVVILTDSTGRTGLGETPGGTPIQRTIEQAGTDLIGEPIGEYRSLLRRVSERYGHRAAGGRGEQTFDLRTTVHAVTALESALLDLARAHEPHLVHGLGARDDAAAMRQLVNGWTFEPKRPSFVR